MEQETHAEKTVQEVFRHAVEDADGAEISVGELLELFGARSFGPLLVVLSIVVIAPTGAIPGVPAVIGLAMILVAGQILFGRDHIWLPKRLGELSFSRNKLERFNDKAKPAFRVLDKVIKPRLRYLTHAPALQLVAIVVILLSLLMVPLEIVPFAVALPAAAILLFGMGLVAHDGIVIALGFAIAAVAAYLSYIWLA